MIVYIMYPVQNRSVNLQVKAYKNLFCMYYLILAILMPILGMG